jgi:5S rRNA maturation endonuclease (ribonuclease M5)
VVEVTDRIEEYVRSRGLVDDEIVGYHQPWVADDRIWLKWIDEFGEAVYRSGRHLADGTPKWKHQRGERPPLFATEGAWDAEEVVLVEGHFDALVSRQAGAPAFATCGSSLKDEAAEILATKRRVTLIADRDEAGERWRTDVIEKLGGPVELSEVQVPTKDLAEFAEGADDPAEAIAELLRGARQIEPDDPSETDAQLHTPPPIAREISILDRFTETLRDCGVIGEERNAKVLYLALTSRLLDEPVSVAIKGLSSSGKSFTVEKTLRFFPPDAYLEMTAMSERALIYTKEEFSHRTIVLFEAVALQEKREKSESNLTAYFVRSLLSEGKISYPVTQRDKDGNFVAKTIVKNGPANLIVTTTSTSLHGENETRLISLPTNDSADQTRAIMQQLARDRSTEVDLSEWCRLQEWVERAEHRVVIPYAGWLAQNVPPVAVRLRRDFSQILRLIRAHAILHQLNRRRDDRGRIVANETDYLDVRSLVADLLADGVGATVAPTMRETVEAVRALDTGEGATVAAVAKRLSLDRSAASRRLQAARERGFVANQEERRGRAARYAIGDPMPDEVVLLPERCPPQAQESEAQEEVCSCATDPEGIATEVPDPRLAGLDEATLMAVRLVQKELGAELVEVRER